MRPITTSNSCSTLVSVVESNDSKLLRTVPPSSLECTYATTSSTSSPLVQEEFFLETNLFLPASSDLAYDYDDEREDDDENDFDTPWMTPVSANSSLSSTAESRQETLRLPNQTSGDSLPMDKYLRSITSVIERAEELQAEPTLLLSDETTADLKVLNICQGEIGHCTAHQADIIVSDKATTCHILAVRSTSTDDSGSEPLVSLCHIDKAAYEECVREMIETHKAHHGELSLDAINMDVHLVGGYSDSDGSSVSITEHLVQLLGKISNEEKEDIIMTLKTCAVSCLNDDGFGAPIGRGLAVEVSSGHVFLAAVDDTVTGPATTLRAARLWSSANRTKLSIVHTQLCDDIIVQPIQFAPFKALDALLRLPDHLMLQYTSTSPEVEDDKFCTRVRSTLAFIRDSKPEDIFGPECNQAVHYSRSNKIHWNLVA